MDNLLLKQIIKRHKEISGDSYLEVVGFDDKKKQKTIKSTFFNLNKHTIEEIQSKADLFNSDSYGVFLNINPLLKPKRIKINIKKILYVFIDLDDAKQSHNELIKDYLKSIKIKYSYNAKSGHGFHFLIPINLNIDNEQKIKGFLNYLKDNVSNKVDIATSDNTRLLRFPQSIHNKDEEKKKLNTIYCEDINEKDIEKNSEIIFKYQVEQKKSKKDIQYQNSIKKTDIFFSTILNSPTKWSLYHKLLSKAKDRNDNFIKNLGFFLFSYPEYKEKIEDFLKNWEDNRIFAVFGWEKKAKEHNLNIHYYELLKWSRENNLKEFTNLLIIQTKESFLDKYEFYYLEDEKPENAFLLFYPNKNYYVQKSLNDVLLNIYYDCMETGIDLIKEFNLENLENWEKKTFKQKISIILSTIQSKIYREKRLKMVFNINYEPTDNKFCYLDNKKYFNTYNKTELWDYYEKKQNYHFPHIKELLMNLCGKDEKNYNYLNEWLSWQINHPTEKLPTAIILQGRQGSGKGTFKSLILDNIFGSNCQEINQTHLESSFNEYLMGKQIIVANEVMHNENRQTLPNVLKNLVTDDKLTISRKFKKEIESRNYTHWIFCTNSDNPIKIEEDDRRYSVFYSKKMRKGLGKALRQNIDFEIKEYISYLKNISPNFDIISEPIMTEAKREIINMNKDSVEKFRESLQQYSNLFEAYINIFGHDKEYKILNDFGDGKEYITTEKFYLLYEKYCEVTKEKGIFSKQNFSKRLSNKGIKSLPKWKDNKTHRTFDVDLIEQWIKIN